MVLNLFRLPKLVLNGLCRLIGTGRNFLHRVSRLRYRAPKFPHLSRYVQNAVGHLPRDPHHLVEQVGNIILLPIQFLQLSGIDFFQCLCGKTEENRHKQQKRHPDLIACHIRSVQGPHRSLPSQKHQIRNKTEA